MNLEVTILSFRDIRMKWSYSVAKKKDKSLNALLGMLVWSAADGKSLL